MDPSESSQSALEVPALLISCISFFAFFTVLVFFPPPLQRQSSQRIQSWPAARRFMSFEQRQSTTDVWFTSLRPRKAFFMLIVDASVKGK